MVVLGNKEVETPVDGTLDEVIVGLNRGDRGGVRLD